MSLMRAVVLFVLFVLLFLSRHPVVAQDLVAHARELYANAYYDEALIVLEGIESNALAAGEQQTIREYRVLCLIALDRVDDAVRMIEQMIDADPFYRPAAERRPRRLMTLFEQVRRERLPALGRERYATATVAFDEHRNADAADGFAFVLRLIDEAKEAGSSGEQDDHELTRLKAFATRFLELVRARDRRTQALPQAPGDAFDSADASVTPPVSIRQEIPVWQSPTLERTPFEGQLEVVIDAAGTVRDARLTIPIHPAYDPIILDSAKRWKYRPATKDGRPVVYRKVITISLAPQRSLDSGP